MEDSNWQLKSVKLSYLWKWTNSSRVISETIAQVLHKLLLNEFVMKLFSISFQIALLNNASRFIYQFIRFLLFTPVVLMFEKIYNHIFLVTFILCYLEHLTCKLSKNFMLNRFTWTTFKENGHTIRREHCEGNCCMNFY